MEEIQNLVKSIIDTKVDFDSPKILGLHGIKRRLKRILLHLKPNFIEVL